MSTDQTTNPPQLDLGELRGWIEVGIPCSPEHALEVIARAEAAEAKIAAVRELREGDLCSHCLSELQDALDSTP